MLKPNPRSQTRDAFTEAELDADAGEDVAYDVESAEWKALTPSSASSGAAPVFVDGVQRLDLGVLDDVPGERPVPGILASYAAAALAPYPRSIAHVRVERGLIMGEGKDADALLAIIGQQVMHYEPYSCHGSDAQAFNARLMDLRARLEAQIIEAVSRDGAETIICDGRLPPIGPTRAIGLIKTPHVLPFAEYGKHFELLPALRTAERSPVLKRRRSGRDYYAWFVCLRTPTPAQFSLSGVVMLEMDTSNSMSDVVRCADYTATRLPQYASDDLRDTRAPQNLLPVGELERELRRRLGDPELVERACRVALARRNAA